MGDLDDIVLWIVLWIVAQRPEASQGLFMYRGPEAPYRRMSPLSRRLSESGPDGFGDKCGVFVMPEARGRSPRFIAERHFSAACIDLRQPSNLERAMVRAEDVLAGRAEGKGREESEHAAVASAPSIGSRRGLPVRGSICPTRRRIRDDSRVFALQARTVPARHSTSFVACLRRFGPYTMASPEAVRHRDRLPEERQS